MYVLSGCERKRRGCLFSQLRSRARCFFYADKKGKYMQECMVCLKVRNNSPVIKDPVCSTKLLPGHAVAGKENG